MPVKLSEDVFCVGDRHVIRARPTNGSDRGKRDLTLIVRYRPDGERAKSVATVKILFIHHLRDGESPNYERPLYWSC